MTLLAPACVLLLADTHIASERARLALERALDDFEPAPASLEFLPNEPMWERSFTHDPRRSSRRVYTLVAPGQDDVIPPRAFDAAVLFVSARQSVTKDTVARVHELACVHRGALALCITECAHPDALAELVEIESRELFESFGLDGDALVVIRSDLPARSEPDDGARELIAWLDENASVCADAAELPFVGQIVASQIPGWTSIRKHQGHLSRGAKVSVLQGAVVFDATVIESWDRVRAGRPSMGVGVINARIDHPMTVEENWVVAQRSITARTGFEAALFGVESLIDGVFGTQVELGWGSDVIFGRIELRSSRAGGLALARIECEGELCLVERASLPLWFDGERAGRAVVVAGL